ncbi:hypothetical protein [Campylobacter sp.]|uniref:hypothetical protein n=1 Tax=Campylobacter sp. TaxID=205 RepID=UPI0025BAFCC8|nr:hypothetical protein [Campylobacter sp.]
MGYRAAEASPDSGTYCMWRRAITDGRDRRARRLLARRSGLFALRPSQNGGQCLG